MSYGLMGVGRNTANEANAGFSSADQLENNREMGNRQLASARDAQKKQTMGSSFCHRKNSVVRSEGGIGGYQAK